MWLEKDLPGQEAKNLVLEIIIDKIMKINSLPVLCAEEINLDSNFAKDWGFDSLDILELGYAIERVSGVEIESMFELGDVQHSVNIRQVMDRISATN